MTSIERWRGLMLDEMKAVLKPLGFKKSGINFSRRQEPAWMVFNLQSSSWNSVDQPMVVYGNIGLFYTEADAELKNPKAGPSAPYCHWHARVQGDRRDSWEIVSDAQATTTGSQIAQAGLEILQRVVERYPDARRMLEAHSQDGQADFDLCPLARCSLGYLRSNLGL